MKCLVAGLLTAAPALLLAAAPAAPAAPAAAAAPATSVSAAPSLPLPALLAGAQAALAACHELGYKVTVTVLADDRVARVVLRDTGATFHGVEISRRKAYTALKSGTSSKDFGLTLPPEQRIMPPPGYTGPFPPPGPVKDDPSLDPGAGGLPVIVDGRSVGAIGVSGAPDGDKDESCASRGVATLMTALQ